ncbi:excalibur calcium-binding domain-containing protein [Rhodococcus wratislaviensis]
MRGSGGCGTSAYYSKCADARAAGAPPLYVPGYRSDLDRDDGGVTCE